MHEEAGLLFLEIWMSTPLAECERRDSKGLYALARQGQLPGFTGIDDPYEEPLDPDLALDTTSLAIGETADLVLRLMDDAAG
jgi:sulfate adenylyltransferase